jgi:hypothetical protein
MKKMKKNVIKHKQKPITKTIILAAMTAKLRKRMRN